HLPGLDGTEDGIQLIELQLLDVDLAEEIRGEGLELLSRFHQPVQDGIGGDLKDPRGGAKAKALSQACQDADDQFHLHLLAMKNRAVVLREIPLARSALELAPLAAIRMAIGTEVAPPQPTAIATARVGAKML